MKRTFLALPVKTSENFLQFYDSLRNKLKDVPVKWVRKDHMHLTLYFRAETSTREVKDLIRIAGEAAASTENFRLEFNKFGVFPSMKRPRVIWIAPGSPESIMQLYSNLEPLLEKAGLSPANTPPFKPHLTLGRIRWIEDLQLLRSLENTYSGRELLDIEIDRMVYYQSTLLPEGPEYEVISDFALSNI